MSGSQPATVGELHPLHRKALRHPLILDGLFTFAPCGASVNCACTFYLVFKEPALPEPDPAPRRQAECALPRVFLRWGNLTILLAFSCSCQPPGVTLSSLSGVAISLQRNEARRKTAWGLCEPEGLLKDPATGRVTLGRTNIRGDPGTVNPSLQKVDARLAQPGLSHQLDERTFTTC